MPITITQLITSHLFVTYGPKNCVFVYQNHNHNIKPINWESIEDLNCIPKRFFDISLNPV
ncbi:hypothetical protein Hanom_Chr06g00500231 [Helianthus anomalus]